MLFRTVLTAVSLTALSTAATAQGFSGGELTIDATQFSAGSDPTSVNYSGALEYSINRNISVAGAVSIYDYSLLADTITNVTLHGIYHVNDQASVGAFVGQDSVGGAHSSFAGIEGGYEMGQFEVEGYLAFYDNADNSSVLGVSGAYQFNDQFAAIADFGVGEFGFDDVTRVSAGAEYTFNGGPSLYAELGNINSDIADSRFIGIGASIEFGADRGTTFDRRGVFETINPGF